VFLILWDDYHIGSFGSVLLARDDLTRIVLGAFGSADLVAIMDPFTTLDAISFTRDRRRLAEPKSWRTRPGTIEDQQLLAAEHVRSRRRAWRRPGEPSEGCQHMHKKDTRIAHGAIVPRSRDPQKRSRFSNRMHRDGVSVKHPGAAKSRIRAAAP
jgi:hypothetical protein